MYRFVSLLIGSIAFHSFMRLFFCPFLWRRDNFKRANIFENMKVKCWIQFAKKTVCCTILWRSRNFMTLLWGNSGNCLFRNDSAASERKYLYFNHLLSQTDHSCILVSRSYLWAKFWNVTSVYGLCLNM